MNNLKNGRVHNKQAPGNRGKSFQVMIIDESGAKRHTMTRAELERLYKEIERFVADCTREEYLVYQKEIRGVYTLIHERERTAGN